MGEAGTGARRAWAGWIGAAALLAAPALAEPSPEDALALVDASRAEAGLAPLTIEEALVAAARAHAEDMLARDYYAHDSPEGATVMDRYRAEGGSEWRLVAENIALCEGCPTPPDQARLESFHGGWMESPSHREAILDPGLDAFGFGWAAGEDVVYAVQTFSGPGRPRGLAPDEAEEALAAEALAARATQAVNAAREAQGAPPLSGREALDAGAARFVEGGALAAPEGGLAAALPEAAQGEWARLGLVSGGCGGCGAVPTAIDAADFVADWLEDPALAETLLDPEAAGFGFALSADGEGRKAAAALVGAAR